MTIPVSLQLAGDEIFAPTNPTVHCGRGGGASRVDISTRLRSGVGGLEAEEKTEVEAMGTIWRVKTWRENEW